MPKHNPFKFTFSVHLPHVDEPIVGSAKVIPMPVIGWGTPVAEIEIADESTRAFTNAILWVYKPNKIMDKLRDGIRDQWWEEHNNA